MWHEAMMQRGSRPCWAQRKSRMDCRDVGLQCVQAVYEDTPAEMRPASIELADLLLEDLFILKCQKEHGKGTKTSRLRASSSSGVHAAFLASPDMCWGRLELRWSGYAGSCTEAASISARLATVCVAPQLARSLCSLVISSAGDPILS